MNGMFFKYTVIFRFTYLLLFVFLINSTFCSPKKNTNDKPKPNVTDSSILKIVKFQKRSRNSKLHTEYFRGYIKDNLTFNMTLRNTANHTIYINYCEFQDSFINITYRDPITKIPGCVDSCCFPMRLISYMDCNPKRLKLNPGDENDFILNLIFKEDEICLFAENIITKLYIHISSDDDISYLVKPLSENKITEYRDNFGCINYYYPIMISYWLHTGMYLELDSSLFFQW